MMKAKSYRELEIWKRSFEIAIEIYQLSQKFPPEERYGLTQQLRRSATSIPLNIAEGFGRYGKKEFSHFLSIALGSIAETETNLLFCHRFGYLEESQLTKLLKEYEEIGKMVNAMRKKLTSNP